MSEYVRFIISPVSIADWLLLPTFITMHVTENGAKTQEMLSGLVEELTGREIKPDLKTCRIKDRSLLSLLVAQNIGNGGSKYVLELKKDCQ